MKQSGEVNMRDILKDIVKHTHSLRYNSSG